MLKRDITQLSVYRIDEEKGAISAKLLQNLYLEKTSEIIYIVKDNKLYGIVCMWEIMHPNENGEVYINKKFTRIIGYNIIEAHEIFRKHTRIHEIPVVNEQGELLGDYSRWNDLLYINRELKTLKQVNILKRTLELYDTIFVVEPSEKERTEYLKFLEAFQEAGITYTIISREQVGEKIYERSIYIFLDEDEKRSAQCYYGIQHLERSEQGYQISQYDMLGDRQRNIRLVTCRDIICQVSEKYILERTGIEKPENLPMNRLDEKATVLLSALQKKGINCFCMYRDELKITEYGRRIRDELEDRLKCYPIDPEEPWPKKAENDEFYAELYEIEDYEKNIAQKEIYSSIRTFGYKKNLSGKYFNALNGRRITCFQPDEYIGTIYLFGPCTIIGGYAEDQYTIESYLQQSLQEKGYAYRVENYGGMLRYDSEIDSKLEQIGVCREKDILIYLLRWGMAAGVQGGSLERIFESHQVPSTWISDRDLCFHCSHKANKVIASGIFDMITPLLTKANEGR